MSNELIETWKINVRTGLYLLENIDSEWFMDTPVANGRSVGDQFAHLHNVRLMWLKSAAPELLEGLNKLEKEQDLSKNTLKSALETSGSAISELIGNGIVNRGKIKGFKPHVTAFVGYLISHESHHRGQVMLILKGSGRKLSKSIGFGLWEWGVR